MSLPEDQSKGHIPPAGGAPERTVPAEPIQYGPSTAPPTPLVLTPAEREFLIKLANKKHTAYGSAIHREVFNALHGDTGWFDYSQQLGVDKYGPKGAAESLKAALFPDGVGGRGRPSKNPHQSARAASADWFPIVREHSRPGEPMTIARFCEELGDRTEGYSFDDPPTPTTVLRWLQQLEPLLWPTWEAFRNEALGGRG